MMSIVQFAGEILKNIWHMNSYFLPKTIIQKNPYRFQNLYKCHQSKTNELWVMFRLLGKFSYGHRNPYRSINLYRYHKHSQS